MHAVPAARYLAATVGQRTLPRAALTAEEEAHTAVESIDLEMDSDRRGNSELPAQLEPDGQRADPAHQRGHFSQGAVLSQFFVFGETGHLSFGNKLTTDRSDSPTHLNAVAPFLLVGYGMTDHLEINVAPTAIWWQASQLTSTGERTFDSELGLGDTAIYLKYRPIVQDPNSWRPSMTICAATNWSGRIENISF